jgi:hypothetical protein
MCSLVPIKGWMDSVRMIPNSRVGVYYYPYVGAVTAGQGFTTIMRLYVQ